MAIQPATHQVAAAEDVIERAAKALRANNIEVVIVDTGAEAREAVLARVPEGSEVHSGKSKTLEDIGVYDDLHEPGRFDAIRPKIFAMDRATHAREIRKLGAAPDTIVGSVNAITEDGALVAVSALGNQLGSYAAGAGRVILVIGSQKFVPDLETALSRVREVVFPYENDRVHEKMGVDTKLEKVLIIFGEWLAGRTTVIIVREPVGV